jgi:hypothetical protein
MKALIPALALAALIAAPAFTQSAAAAPKVSRAAAQSAQSGKSGSGYYRGYPLEQWYRTDTW